MHSQFYIPNGHADVGGAAPLAVLERGGGGRLAVVWDDVLQPGRTKIDLRSLPKDTRVYDAMGNELSACGLAEAEVGPVPLFVVRPAAP